MAEMLAQSSMTTYSNDWELDKPSCLLCFATIYKPIELNALHIKYYSFHNSPSQSVDKTRDKIGSGHLPFVFLSLKSRILLCKLVTQVPTMALP